MQHKNPLKCPHFTAISGDIAMNNYNHSWNTTRDEYAHGAPALLMRQAETATHPALQIVKPASVCAQRIVAMTSSCVR
jgi:hypothetical protein